MFFFSLIQTGIVADQQYLIPIELTCALSSSTTITYSLCDYLGSSPPTWASLDTTNCKLVFTAEKQPTQKIYTFAINSDFAGSTKQALKPVYLTVDAIPLPACLISNCTECKWYDGTKCKTCGSGYSIANNDETKCVQNNSTVSTTTESVTTMATSGVSCAAVIFLSCLNLSSITILYAIFSQLRTLLYLILTDVYIPDSVKNYLKGMKIFTFSFSFLSIGSISFIKTGVNPFNIPNQSEVLNEIGLDSESSIINNLNLVATIIVIILIHLVIRNVIKCCCKCLYNKNHRFCYKLLTKTISLSCVSEVYHWDTSSRYKTISLIASILLFIFCLVCWVIMLVKWIKVQIPKNEEEEDNTIFAEMFKDTKHTFRSKGFSFYNYTRTIALVYFLIFSTPLESILPWWFVIKVYGLVIIQAIYLILIVVVRPINKSQANLIQISNESIFFILCCILIFYNKKERWNSLIEEIYIRIITSSSLLTLAIIICSLIVNIVKRCRKRCKKVVEITPKITKVEVMKIETKFQFSKHEEIYFSQGKPENLDKYNPSLLNEEVKQPAGRGRITKIVAEDDSNIEFYSSLHRQNRDALQPVQSHLEEYNYTPKIYTYRK